MSIALAREWHVSERPTAQAPTGDEPLRDVHYMIDPGDGLCSTVVYGVPNDIAHLIAAAPAMRETLWWVRQTVHQAHHDGEAATCPKNTCDAITKVLAEADGQERGAA